METSYRRSAFYFYCKKHRLLLLWLMGLVLWLTFLSNSAVAQVAIAVGPKAGVAITSFYGLDANNVSSRTSWIGGIFVNAQVSPVFVIQPELLLSRRGAITTNNNVENRITINYFEVPVLAKLRLPVGNFFPHVLLGPNFSFRTNSKYSRTDTQSGTAVTADLGNVQKSDVGGLVGVGVDLQSARNGLFFTIDGRYGFGFKNLGSGDFDLRLKNSGWAFAAGVGLRLGRQ